MSTEATVALIVIGVAVLVLIAYGVWYSSRRRTERRRTEAAEHRDLAAVARVEADRRAAEAEERAARARREQLAAEQHRLEAQRAAQEVSDLERRADALDPDVDHDAELAEDREHQDH
jgi:FtsZ-interacting cell division protein ZipA